MKDEDVSRGLNGREKDAVLFGEGRAVGEGQGASTSWVVAVACFSDTRLLVDWANSLLLKISPRDPVRPCSTYDTSSCCFLSLTELHHSNGLFLPDLTVSVSSNWFIPNFDPVKDR